jgi:hypothetical protein
MIRKKQYDAIYPNPAPKPKKGDGPSGWGGTISPFHLRKVKPCWRRR